MNKCKNKAKITMRQLSPSYLLLILIFFISSCATNSGPIFTQEPISSDSNPNLYIYRPNSAYLMGSKWQFAVDKDTVVILKNGTYAKLSLTPGKHEIVSGMSNHLSQPPLRIFIDAERGKNIYVKYELHTNLLISLLDSPKFNNRLYEVEEAQALNELKELHQVK